MPDRILNKVNSITNSDLYTWCDEYININEKKILDLVRNRMLKGKDTDGNPIGFYRQLSYKMFKEKLNPMAKGNVDLFLTGDLQRNLTFGKMGKDYQIYSTDWKYHDLFYKYGGATAFGLTEDQHKEILSEMTIYVIEKIFEKILK